MAQILMTWRACVLSVVMTLARGQGGPGGPCNTANRSPLVQQVPLKNGKGVVVCDFETESGLGPWIVMQRRVSGEVDFNRRWNDYNRGFGQFYGSFWLGLKNIQAMCNRSCFLRVDYKYRGKTYYREYSGFLLAKENDDYRLKITNNIVGNDGNGNATEDFNLNTNQNTPNGKKFTTTDRANDQIDGKNCAVDAGGGWWWPKACGETNLNGVYHTAENDPKSISWGDHTRLEFTELKLSQADRANWAVLDTTAITAGDAPAAQTTSGSEKREFHLELVAAVGVLVIAIIA